MKVKITWSTGKVELLDRSDCETIEQVTNSVFGSQWELAESHGVTVAEATDEEFFAAHAESVAEQEQADEEVIEANSLQQANDAPVVTQGEGTQTPAP